MVVNVNVEIAIIGLAELNNMVQFINSHDYDIKNVDAAVGMLHIIAGELDARTKTLITSYYGDKRNN